MSLFPQTNWSLVDLASGESWTGSREKIGELIETYRQPMYAHLRSRGMKHEQAEDLLQEFFVEILNGKLLNAANPAKGKFRTLLLTALNRFAVGKRRYETAAKRSPEQLASLDAAEGMDVSASSADPAMIYERAWALDVLAQALAQMQAECEKEGEIVRWSIFRTRIIDPLINDVSPPDYKDLATRHELTNDKAAMNLLVTGKRQFDRILRAIVRDYVTKGSDQDAVKLEVAKQLEQDEPDAAAAKRVADQLVEQSIRRKVQEEIGHLGEILRNSRNMSDKVVLTEMQNGNIQTDLKQAYWCQLSQTPMSSGLENLYFENESNLGSIEIPSDFYFSAALDTKISELPESRIVCPKTLRECFADPDPDIELLRDVKDWANSFRVGRQDVFPKELASGIYFLAIAVALVRLSEEITGLNAVSMKTGFSWIGGQNWLTADFEELIAQAIQKCS